MWWKLTFEFTKTPTPQLRMFYLTSQEAEVSDWTQTGDTVTSILKKVGIFLIP